MKVRCVGLLDSRGKPVERSAWAKLGSVYRVLSIWVEPGQILLRLVGEEPAPALFEAEMFEVVSNAIPSAWVITMPKPGCLSIGPARWSRPGFWEEYFDRKPEAVACFEEERQEIVSFEP